MTRETKVGLAIAGTVFVLVGGAVGYKLYFLKPQTTEIAEKTSDSSATAQVIPAKPESATAASPATVTQEQPTPFQGEIRTNPEGPPVAPNLSASSVPESASPPVPEIPSPPPILVEAKPPVSLADVEKTISTKPAEAKAPSPASPVSTVSPAPPLVNPPTSSTPPASPPGTPELAPTAPPLASAPLPPQPSVPESKPSFPAPASREPTAPESAPVISPSSANPVPVTTTPNKPGAGSAFPAPISHPPSGAGTESKPSVATNSSDSAGQLHSPAGSADKPATNIERTPSAPSTPSIPVVIPAPPPSDAFDRSYSAPPPPASLVANRTTGPKPEDAIPVTVRPQTQPLAPAPPDAFPVKIAPTPPNKDRVEVFDYEVQRYTIRPGDNWELLSRWKYGTERFAQALATYNRERDPRLAQLSVGVVVFLPPAEVLQRRYPQLVGNHVPWGNPGSAPGHVPAPGYTPSGTSGASNPTLTTPVENSTGGPYRFYRVQANDTLWLIAKRTLGSGDRWPEIYRLNRDVIQDVNHLPPGTTLRLPSDARVDNPAGPR
ncbi:MAG: LysM peptidoglycan-binding domain-containing protein [Gemmatales bacterium]|nr:LysM peptidoglycan-binding domain-containing protein [Gemmatales bacterium]MDW8222532.1 LysM peptidoglycan-binding domain-containing protein [Gemmatales bacterium]